MEPELEPPQPSEVVAAVKSLLAEPDGAPDPWWQAGIEEALGS